jgi:hypothetical protein
MINRLLHKNKSHYVEPVNYIRCLTETGAALLCELKGKIPSVFVDFLDDYENIKKKNSNNS